MQSELEYEIENLKYLLGSVLTHLNSITFENFEIKFQEAKNTMILANELRKQLAGSSNVDEYKKSEKELLILAKLIRESYDNVLRKIKEEQENIALQLKSLGNRKKIAMYEVGK